MAVASIIANGTTAATSAEITVAAGSTTMLSLRVASGTLGVPNDCKAQIQKKDSAGNFVALGTLDAKEPVKLLEGPIIFKVHKPASTVSHGVDQDT